MSSNEKNISEVGGGGLGGNLSNSNSNSTKSFIQVTYYQKDKYKF